ncbi:MAG: hypothetical protein J6A25_03315 [Lachnospiraceae bacterium]|nr:hypothetical protein [Lachnospiraceae bacterium]
MGLDLKKNEKMTKAITVVLAGVLILIVLMPVKNNSESNIGATQSKEASIDYHNQMASYYEEKLKGILEESYGEGTMEVMVRVSKNKEDSMYGASDENYVVEGVLVVANVNDENAISDISFAICALFDLPAHRVAVMTKN